MNNVTYLKTTVLFYEGKGLGQNLIEKEDFQYKKNIMTNEDVSYFN